MTRGSSTGDPSRQASQQTPIPFPEHDRTERMDWLINSYAEWNDVIIDTAKEFSAEGDETPLHEPVESEEEGDAGPLPGEHAEAGGSPNPDPTRDQREDPNTVPSRTQPTQP